MTVWELIEELEQLPPGDEVQDEDGRIVDIVECDSRYPVVYVYRKLSSRMRQFLLQIKLYWIACVWASFGGLIQTA
jgi:hypothetical protein